MVVNQSMRASTIAEVHINENSILLELEIGSADMLSFHSILPDQLMKELKVDVPPLEQRIATFFESGVRFQIPNGEVLKGTIEESKLMSRMLRDDVSGEVLAESADERVLFISLRYPLVTSPSELVISAPRVVKGITLPNIGFKLFHNGVAVNDFRHLSGELKLLLDWDDSWYSRFELKNYLRQYREPINTFIYVENFETRVEIVARLRDLAEWAGVEVADEKSIGAAQKKLLLEQLGAFLTNEIDLKINGESAEVELERMHFLRRTLRSSTVIPEDESVNKQSAMMGFIFNTPTVSLPQNAKLTWGFFPTKHPQVNAAATDEAGPMPVFLSPDYNVLEWKNYLTSPTIPRLVDIDLPVTTEKWLVPVGSLVVALVAVVVLFIKKLSFPPRLALCLVSLGVAFSTKNLVLAEVDSPFPVQATMDDDAIKSTFTKLLKNIYVSFEFQKEDEIYDKLARSVDGELLTQVYLETRASLVLENQGGAEVKVNKVEVIEAEQVEVAEDGTIISNCTWGVTGSVGHWGHVHQRTNKYEAKISLKVVDGEWKIVDLDLLNEERIQ